MKYDMVNIIPRKGTWEVWYQRDDTDRQEITPTPHPLGFLYYQRGSGDEEAFNELKNYLVSHHTEEIKRLEKSLDSLLDLEYKKP